MRVENWGEIERRHFESIVKGEQIVLLQAFFRLFENRGVKQLKFRKLFRVCFH